MNTDALNCPATEDDTHPLAPARGVVIGLSLSVPIWGVGLLLVLAWLG